MNTVPLHLLERIATHSMQGFSSGIKLIFWTCFQRSAPLSTAIFVTTISDNEMCLFQISNEEWDGRSDFPGSPIRSREVAIAAPSLMDFYKVLFIYLIYRNYCLIAPMVLAHPLHPIDNRSRNRRRNLWVGWCVSSWWPLFPSRSSVLIYTYYYYYIYIYICSSIWVLFSLVYQLCLALW